MDNFTKAYVAAALWSSMDDNDEPLDKTYGPDQISDELHEEIAEDCRQFQEVNSKLWEDVEHTSNGSESWDGDEQAGHDFWLTRNGHGCGFWARPDVYGEKNAEALTAAAHQFGSFNLYTSSGEIFGG